MIYQHATLFVGTIDKRLHLDLAQQTQLIDNLSLLLIKVQESGRLSVTFQLEYQDIRKYSYPQLAPIEDLIHDFIHQHFTDPLTLHLSLAHMIHLLIQQACMQADPIIAKGLFIFQGDPAWKVYLFHELKDYLGRRISLEAIESDQLTNKLFATSDFILSNFPIESADCPIYYLSMVPTKNELDQVSALIQRFYLNYR